MKRSMLFAFALSLLAGCAATGMKHAELAPLMPKLTAEDGRVYFIRKAAFAGGGVRPDIYLDGQKVGSSQPGGFFYVDTKAGPHEASATTEAKRGLSFSLDAGETKYIRSFPTIGILVGRVNFELVNADEAQKELETLSYTGEPLAAKPSGN